MKTGRPRTSRFHVSLGGIGPEAGRRWLRGAGAVALMLGLAGLALAGDGGKPRKPQLDLRASPRMAFPPVEILVTGQLKDGADLEEFYCPGLEWDWGDGTRSAHESDCEPYEPSTPLVHLFTARHAYNAPGAYHVRLTLRRADRTVAAGSVAVMIHGASQSDN
jgi:hypothetical protein